MGTGNWGDHKGRPHGRSLLAVVVQDFEPTPWPVRIVYAGGRHLPIKFRAFIDFAAPRLNARLSQSEAKILNHHSFHGSAEMRAAMPLPPISPTKGIAPLHAHTYLPCMVPTGISRIMLPVAYAPERRS
jgi:hypothetical protein